MTDQPIQRRKISHEVMDRLLQRIRNGEWGPGDQLPSERELMETYGVGRPAIREAKQDLARSGILEIAHGERARVALPTADDLINQIAGGARHLLRMQPNMLDHVKEARIFLETELCRMAASKANDDDIARLQKRLDEHRAALQAMDEFLHRDMLFHREIAMIAGNPIFPAVVEALFGWAGDYYATIVRAPGAELVTLQEHKAILDAIAARNPEAAAQAMRLHLTRANSLYQNVPSAQPLPAANA